jgi:hypothetical protein
VLHLPLPDSARREISLDFIATIRNRKQGSQNTHDHPSQPVALAISMQIDRAAPLFQTNPD